MGLHKNQTNSGSFQKGYKWEDKFNRSSIEKMRNYSNSIKGKLRSKKIGEKISLSNIGHSVSQGAREKIGQAFNGKTYEEIMGEGKAKEMRELRRLKYLGKGNPFHNKTHDKKTKEIMSSLKLGKTHEEIMGKENAEKWLEKMSGKNHPFWRGGFSIKDYKNFTNKFKNLIRKRDNQICMMCGKHREKMKTALPVHHIDYNKYNSIPENCIALCVECHAKTNYNRKYWIKFCQSLLHDRYGYNYDKIVVEIK